MTTLWVLKLTSIGPFYSFLIIQTVGKAAQHTQNKHGQTSMPQVELEPMTPVC